MIATRIAHAGRPLNRPDWPEAGTLAGVLQAIGQWELDRRLDYFGDPQIEPHPLDGHFKSPALCGGGVDRKNGKPYYLKGTEPVYPDMPGAVCYLGNFVGYSFGFNLTTNDPEVIAQMDAAIAANLSAKW